MVLTEEQQTDMYPAATMETATATTEETFYSNLNTTRTDAPAGYGGGTPQKAAKLKAAGGSQKIGPAITLKVMAGDKFNLTVNSWWNSGSTPGTPVSPLTDLLSALTNSIGGITSTHGGATVSELQTGNLLNSGATDFLGSQTYNSSRPKAFINWVLFDEQFKFVAGSSGIEQVAGSNVYSTHTRTDLPIDKNGYLYIYVSNETPNIDVFFDNLQVTHIRGPVLEETHYYPFGLTMAGISSKALTFGNPENKQEKFQGQPFDDDLGINYYGFKWRHHDSQIGRFIQIDPLSEEYVYNSTYAFSENKVVAHRELEGLEARAIFNGAWGEIGVTQTTETQINVTLKAAAEDLAPIADATLKVGKYGLLIAGILTGNPAAIILGIPALGLTVSQDVALAVDPDNKEVQEMPTSVGGAIGAMVDKTKEAVTGVESNGAFQAVGEFVEAASSVKTLLTKPIISQGPAQNIEKVNILVEVVDKTKELFNVLTGASSTPAPTTTKPDDKNKQ